MMLLTPLKLIAVSLLLLVLTNAQPIKSGADSKKEAEEKGGLMLGKIWNESLDNEGDKTVINVFNTTASISSSTASPKEADTLIAGVSGEREHDSDKKNAGKAKASVEYEVSGLGKDEEKKVAKIEQLFGKINDYLVCTYENKEDCDRQLIRKASAEKEAKKLERKFKKETNKNQMERIKTNPWWTSNNRQNMFGSGKHDIESERLPRVLIDEPLAGTHHNHPRFPVKPRQPLTNGYFPGARPHYPIAPMPMQHPHFPMHGPMNSHPISPVFPEAEIKQMPAYRMGYYDESLYTPLHDANWRMPARNSPQRSNYAPRPDNHMMYQSAAYWPPMQDKHNDLNIPLNEMKLEFPVRKYRGFQKDNFQFDEKEEKTAMLPYVRHKQQSESNSFTNDRDENKQEQKPAFEKQREWPTKYRKTRVISNEKNDEESPTIRRVHLTTYSKGWENDEDNKPRVLKISHRKDDIEELDEITSSLDDVWKNWENEKNDQKENAKPVINNSRKVRAMESSVDKNRRQHMDWPTPQEQPTQHVKPLHQRPFYGPQSESQEPWPHRW